MLYFHDNQKVASKYYAQKEKFDKATVSALNFIIVN